MTSILDLLRSPDSPPRAILHLLPGTSERRDLLTFVAETAERGPVLLLVKRQVELDQWSAKLQGVISGSLVKLTSTDEALQLMEGDVLGTPGVILSTVQRARRGPMLSLLKGIEVELLVVDGPIPSSVAGSEETTAVGQLMAIVASRARRTVIVVSGTLPYEWDGAVSLREISQDDFSRAADNVNIIDVLFAPTPEEVQIQYQARSILRPHLPRLGGRTLSVAGNFELHHRLLLLLTGRSDGDADPGSLEQKPALVNQEAESAWNVLDALENLPDSKLQALDSALQQTTDRVACVLITATLIQDVSYIADHLMQAGHRDVRALTSLTDPSDRDEALRFATPGQIVVAGRLAYGLLEQWPTNCDAVWWSSPGTQAEFEHRMELLATGGEVRVYRLTPADQGPEPIMIDA